MRKKSRKTRSAAVKGTTNALRPGSKVAKVAKLLRRPKGCTAGDVLKATGWPTVSMPQQAKAIGVGLRTEKDGRVTRYWAA